MSIFTKSNMVIRTELAITKFGLNILIPFEFKLKDISADFLEEETEVVIEDYSADISCEQEVTDKMEEYMKLISFIDLSKFTIDEIDEEYKEHMTKTPTGYVFTSHIYLYSFFIRVLMFNEVDFKLMSTFVEDNQIRLITNFSSMVERELMIGDQTGECSEAYMELRSAFELNKPPIFKENIGKSVEEHSFRETKLQRIYIGRKCEIDRIQYEKHMKEMKQNKS